MSTVGERGPSGSLVASGSVPGDAAVMVVLGQVAVGEHALDRGVGREGVDAAGGSDRHRERHDRHRLVPRRRARVVGARDREHVALLDRHAPVGRRRGHRDVPRHGAGRLVVVGARAEDLDRAPGARDLEVGPQAAGVQVARRADERAVVVGGPGVARRAAAVGVGDVVGEGDAAVVSRALDGVEDRVGAAAHDVEPLRPDLVHPERGLGAERDEVHLPGDVDPRGRRGEVVDHVVEQPLVVLAVAPAEALGLADRRLLLARPPTSGARRRGSRRATRRGAGG